MTQRKRNGSAGKWLLLLLGEGVPGPVLGAAQRREVSGPCLAWLRSHLPALAGSRAWGRLAGWVTSLSFHLLTCRWGTVNHVGLLSHCCIMKGGVYQLSCCPGSKWPQVEIPLGRGAWAARGSACRCEGSQGQEALDAGYDLGILLRGASQTWDRDAQDKTGPRSHWAFWVVGARVCACAQGHTGLSQVCLCL